MTSKILAASLIAFVAATAATAQSDKIHLLNGTVVTGAQVVSYDVRNVRYKRGGSTESVESDQVAKIELGQFKKIYARGDRDPGLMLTLAREQLAAKEPVLAQLGLLNAARQYFDQDSPNDAMAALNELQKEFPEGGVLPDTYRLKFEYYLGTGTKGMGNALKVAKKYESDAIGGAWPPGFTVEATFFQALAEQSSPADYQSKLRAIVSQARSSNTVVANRADVELAHSLRKDKKEDEAKRIYDTIIKKEKVDDSSRAGAYLGLGQLLLAGGDKEEAKQALLLFLRVRLETREAWPSLQAEALYHSINAARKWGGPEHLYIISRCRSYLFSEYPNSEWTNELKQR
jgi:predicted negative regulator of RcsB-dependent stress response